VIELILGIVNQLLRLVDGVFARRKYIRNLADQLETSRQLVHELNSFLIQVDAGRIVLLRANNGSGLPRYGRPHYVSMVDYVNRHGAILTENFRWKEQMIDDWHRNAIVSLASDGYLVIETADLPVGSLKDVYLCNDVIRSIWIPVLELPKEFWFVAIHITRPDEIDKVTERAIACRLQLQSIASRLLKKVTL